MTSIDFSNSIKEKSLDELSLEELAYAHLNDSSWCQTKTGQLTSSLYTVIAEIRHVRSQAYGNSFLPVSAAFTVLDQLGFCYQNKAKAIYTDSNASSIKKLFIISVTLKKMTKIQRLYFH
jgi:uncharacterized membrane protein YfbV (UPF0208 family)